MPQHPPEIGQPRLRIEDEAFLKGAGRYGDDIRFPDSCFAAVVRSPWPHARITRIDTANARGVSGFLLAWTYDNIKADINPLPSFNDLPPFDIRNVDGNTLPNGCQKVLADGRVRYAGEPVAFVVAETPLAAREAAEAVVVDYEPLEAVMTVDAAIASGAPVLHEDTTHNATLDLARGDTAGTDKAFAEAAHVVELSLNINRIAPVFMEPRSAIGRFDSDTGRYRLDAGCQSTHAQKNIAAGVLGIEPDALQVVAPDMGGGFGARNVAYNEFSLVLLAAKALGRPVHFTADRTESFLTDAQARDQRVDVKLALDERHYFSAMRVTLHWRHGAYFNARNVAVMTNFFPPTIGGGYSMPFADIRMLGAFTNTTPLGAFRGIGRLESNYVTERAVDAAAAQLGVDATELRQKNLVSPASMPWVAAGGARYTSGDFTKIFDRANALTDRAGFEDRKRQSAQRGLLRGRGIGMFVENDGAMKEEFASVHVGTDGLIEIAVGTQDFGMGHRTMFGQIAADWLDVPFDTLRIVFGDTDRIARGFGSAGSRSARMGGSAIVRSVEALIDKARPLAADMLEAAVADLEYESGGFTVRGTDRRVSLKAIAVELGKVGQSLEADGEFEVPVDVHSSGCHIAEVEVDAHTGAVRIDRYALVMDVGRAINPRIVEGQLHGGIAQGVGQAWREDVVYDPDSGQTLTGSFMDYCIAKADDMPLFDIELYHTVEADNPVGVKGAGEGPTSGAPGAFVNAVLDAVKPLGVTQLQMPLTSEKVWRAIESTR